MDRTAQQKENLVIVTRSLRYLLVAITSLLLMGVFALPGCRPSSTDDPNTKPKAVALDKKTEPTPVVPDTKAKLQAPKNISSDPSPAFYLALEHQIAALIVKLNDRDPSVRKNAANALGRYGYWAKDAVPALIQAVQDKETVVRIYAALALSRIGP